MKRAKSVRLCLAILLAALARDAHAFRAPQRETLTSQVIAPAGYVATVVPQELSEVKDQLPGEILAEVDAFKAHAGPDWKFYVDRRSGGMALVEGKGLPWLAGGEGSLSALEARARELMRAYPSLFRVAESQLVLDTRGSVSVGERGQYQTIVFRQVAAGVPVDGARVIFRVSRGNLVQFGVDRTVPLDAALVTSSGILKVADARTALAGHVGGLLEADRLTEDGTLLWVPRGVTEDGPYTGPIGEGWRAELVYRFTFLRDGSPASWQALVDARTGEVLRFVDATDYAALVRGSVYTQSNCTDTLACVPGSASESAITVPFALLNFIGGTCAGDACYSNSAGAFDYPSGAVAVSTSLDGKYFRIVDGCGAVAASGVAPANIDLGTSDPNPPLNTNTDCQPATRQSPPTSGALSGGSGDTHSARNTFYHLNLINEKSRVYLPDNEWLKGADGSAGTVIVNTNLPPACNALWQGTTGSLNFMKVTPGLACNNTGELPDVFLHEYGHGLDQNDGTGTAPESATGEAMGDTFALLQGQHSCIGTGFRLPFALDANWGNRAGYGTGSARCSGVREIDYTRFCYHTTAAGCGPSLDPDAPNGSRSGLNPPPSPPDSGTPARYNHMIAGSPTGVTNGQSNFYNCGGPEDTGCAGPLDHGCHCESMIASQANWDLAKRLIAFEFGGDAYAAPQGPREVSGWQYADRLWYLTRDLAVSAYSATGVAPAGTTNGCGIANWFSTYRFIDDDNGNLADGTPHAGIIYSAFDLHAIACGNALDPANQPTGCPAPIAAPTLSVCDSKSPVQLSWTASSGATEYRILRNTLGCGFGFTPIATAAGGRLYFEDADVAPGVPYYYTVQPVGVNEACYGQASNCIAVVPTTCAATTATPPTGVNVSKPGNNQALLSWNAVSGAGSYKVFRKPGACVSAAPFVAINVVTAPATSLLDTDGLQGQQTYSYQVAASDTSCAACTSAPSACVSVLIDGVCTVVPDFGGLTGISAGTAGGCSIHLTWSAAVPHCAGALTYQVFRSTSATFLPSPSNRIVSGLSDTSYTDTSVTGGVRYFYVVRAVDGVGNMDANLVRLDEVPVGTLSPGTYTDDAGDTGTAKLSPGFGIVNTWSIRPNDTGNATRVYATTASGNYSTNTCMALESRTIFLGANPTLTFRSRFDIEQGWDGGYVEVATEAGGFGDWTKLSSVNYPGIMAGPLGDPACGTPGFADGQPVFTGTSTGYQSFSGSLSAYANQNVRVRFLFSSDPSTEAAGWFIDDVAVSGARLPGPCLGEVSGKISGHPLRVDRGAGATVNLVFEDLGGVATSYNVYEGAVGSWYSHAGVLCHVTSSTPGVPVAGERTIFSFAPGGPAVYFLISGSSAAAEGTLGVDSRGQLRPPGAPPCGPTP